MAQVPVLGNDSLLQIAVPYRSSAHIENCVNCFNLSVWGMAFWDFFGGRGEGFKKNGRERSCRLGDDVFGTLGVR